MTFGAATSVLLTGVENVFAVRRYKNGGVRSCVNVKENISVETPAEAFRQARHCTTRGFDLLNFDITEAEVERHHDALHPHPNPSPLKGEGQELMDNLRTSAAHVSMSAGRHVSDSASHLAFGTDRLTHHGEVRICLGS